MKFTFIVFIIILIDVEAGDTDMAQKLCVPEQKSCQWSSSPITFQMLNGCCV